MSFQLIIRKEGKKERKKLADGMLEGVTTAAGTELKGQTDNM